MCGHKHTDKTLNMKIKDKLVIKHKDRLVTEMVYMASTKTQHLFSKPESIVGSGQNCILWNGEIGAVEFTPIKIKHNFVQVNEDTWELDIEPIDGNDL